eukprot:CAMPEP_0115561732 /NCGR_PEP_ID=MMETSP0271-20121206/101132_1 /TAXON_ID=71861 /ORGANISM="Scrippsiella trochoidea, Strain CCMP3099" /LENGTH=205 /DNA_ID=CAMNT_0002995841 /DNA_START=113 /DNA_END=727 /DNA_ORIENTATION=-
MCLNVVASSPAAALSAAAALASMNYSLNDVSGAHFNPAVTFAIVTSSRGKCCPRDGLAHVLTQVIAGILAGLSCASFRLTGLDAGKSVILQPERIVDAFGAGLGEMFFTFVLAYVVLIVATTRPVVSQHGALPSHSATAIASCVVAGGCSLGAVSGGKLNPAVVIGLAMLDLPLETIPISVLWQFVGGLLAAMAFRVTHPLEFAE